MTVALAAGGRAAARLGGALATLFGVTVVVFVVLRVIPGNAITASLGIEAGTLSHAQRAALEHYYGLDKPLLLQFLSWLGQALHGHLGLSLTSGRSVASLIASALPVTLELAVLAAAIGASVGVLLGVLAASRPGSVRDSATQACALFGLAIPEFVLGTVVVAALAEFFGYFPDTGSFVPLTRSFQGNLSQMLYPALVLSVGFMANTMRATRSSYLDVERQDFVRTAHGKGVRPARVRFVHVLRNAAVPIFTLTGIQFGYLLGGTVIIEQIFALPGLGRLLFTSIDNRDYPVVQGVVLVIATSFVAVNLLVDVLYSVIDPRIRRR